MAIFCIALVVVLLFVVLEFNLLVRLKNKIKHSKSSIDVYLTQRFDLIPNLVECVKGYAKYEEETLKNITALRENYYANKDLKIAQDLAGKMNSLIARAEAIAELKASEQFLGLQRNLVKMESQLQAARRLYNGDVTLYNTTIESFPHNIIAGLFAMEQEELFTIDEYKAQNIEVGINK